MKFLKRIRPLHRSTSSCLAPWIVPGLLVLGLATAAQAQNAYTSYPLLPGNAMSITVADRQGRPIGRILPQKRYWTPMNRIPTLLQRAVVAIEDSRFYEHGGVDIRGIARAFVTNLAHGEASQGGSTITQQLVKNKYLTAEKTLDRKLKEAQLAMDLEKKYSKSQILEMYFNEIYFGNGAYGLAQAARLYFDKRPEELNELECILLAGIPKNPNRYNPMSKTADISGRRDVVLKRMVELKIISARQQQSLRSQTLSVRKPSLAPHYLAHIRSKLIQQFGADIIEQGGLDITAAMDLPLQQQAEQAMHDKLKAMSPNLQGALVCLDTATGDVLAAVSGSDPTKSTMNRAFYAKRQPGSTIKPLIYAAAIDHGITASSRWDDTPVAYRWGAGESWKPQNYGHEHFGEQTLRQALAHSNNVITVKVLDTVGVPAFAEFAAKFGLTIRPQNGLSLALGTDEVSLGELVQAYTPLATGGSLVQARTILRIYDRRKKAWTENPTIITPTLSPATSYITTNMMKDVLTEGTAKSLKRFSQMYPAAGKTGTTDNYVDAWFVGFTPKLVTGVWIGCDKPRSMGRGFTGGVVAAPVWERFMRRALAGHPHEDFPKPENLVTATIDPKTHALARNECPTKREEYYLPGTQPAEPCPIHAGEPIPPVLPPPQEPQVPEHPMDEPSQPEATPEPQDD